MIGASLLLGQVAQQEQAPPAESTTLTARAATALNVREYDTQKLSWKELHKQVASVDAALAAEIAAATFERMPEDTELTTKLEKSITQKAVLATIRDRAKTCPFCGSIPVISLPEAYGSTKQEDAQRWYWSIRCIDSACVRPESSDRDPVSALKRWNFRYGSLV